MFLVLEPAQWRCVMKNHDMSFARTYAVADIFLRKITIFIFAKPTQWRNVVTNHDMSFLRPYAETKLQAISIACMGFDYLHAFWK